jgi:ribosome-binding factor A
VYFSLLQPDDDPAEALAALKSASGFLRKRAGTELRMRRLPELRFLHDESARHGFEISRLIDRARDIDGE